MFDVRIVIEWMRPCRNHFKYRVTLCQKWKFGIRVLISSSQWNRDSLNISTTLETTR
jgi:hypothetical protein